MLQCVLQCIECMSPTHSVTFDKNCEPQKGAHQDVEHLESLKKELTTLVNELKGTKS